MAAGLLLAVLGLYLAWAPPETHALTPLILSLGCAGLIPQLWLHTNRNTILRGISLLGPVFLFLIIQGMRSIDRCQASQEIFLFGSLCILFWMASRLPRSHSIQLFFALGLAGLALWGLYQAGGGLEKLQPLVDQLPEASRPAALARISRARAFASLLLPSHLAALLATSVPLLLERVRRDLPGMLSLLGLLIAIAGIAATRSPVGALLAIGAASIVLASRYRRRRQSSGSSASHYLLWALLILLLFGGLTLGALRPDVRHLEPLKLRADNWSAALWIFSRAPVSGAGLGSFGQAVRGIPFPLGNYPLHAHCLPLEFMADLGLAGLLLWAVGMWWLLRIVRQLYRDAPGLAAAILVIPLHNLVDFSIFTAGVAVPWILVLAWAFTRVRVLKATEDAAPLRWRATAFAAAGLAIILSSAHFTSISLESRAKASDGLPLLQRSSILAPWRPTPPEKAARIALESRDPKALEQAEDLLESFHWQRPDSASRAQLLAHIKNQLGRPIEAALLLRQAAQQHFRDSRRTQEYQDFLKVLRNSDYEGH